MNNSAKYEALASNLYETYRCHANLVDGKLIDHPLPDWNTFRADPNTKVQSHAWLCVAAATGYYINRQLIADIGAEENSLAGNSSLYNDDTVPVGQAPADGSLEPGVNCPIDTR